MGRIAARVVDVDLDKDAVARRLVDLDVVFLGEQALELGAVEAGRAAHERHPGRIEEELVPVQRLDRIAPVGVRRAVILETRGAKLRRNHLLRRQDAEILRDQRMRVDLPPELDRKLDRAHDQFIALELHLAPRHVQRGDDLEVWRGRGMRKECLVELLLDRVPVLIADQDHRSLPERRHRLVRRVRLVDAQARLVGIRQELRVEELGICRIELADLLPEGLITLAVVRVAELRRKRGRQRPSPCGAADRARSARSRTRPRPTGKRDPA